MPALDYQTAFQLAPVGMVMSRERVMVDVNDEAARIFGHARATMIGQSFELLYPTHDEYERTGARIIPVMNARGSYSDERIMKRANGELFWCHVTGRSLDRTKPLGEGIWTFEDLSAHRPVTAALTPRERDIAAQLVEGKTSKQIGIYCMSKAAVVHMTKAMALEWGRYGINTNAICPGYIDTEINHHHWETEPGQKLVQMLPRKRVGKPEDLDGLILLLASDQSDFINGAIINADDGMV